MSNITVLNNIDHSTLKVNVNPADNTSLNVNRTQVYASEIADLQKEFPVLIYREEATETLQLHAILGLEKDENLFLDDNGWMTRFVPSLLARGPFSIGYPQAKDEGEKPAPMICIDLDDARVNEDTGEDIFLPMGGESSYLQYVKKALQTVETGAQYNQTLFALVTEMDLLEPVSVEIKLSNVEQVKLNNYYTINQQKLASLSGEQLTRLNQFGMLGPLYLLMASMGNFQRLIALKNARNAMI